MKNKLTLSMIAIASCIVILSGCGGKANSGNASIIGTWTFISERAAGTSGSHSIDTTFNTPTLVGISSFTFLPNGHFTDIGNGGNGYGSYRLTAGSLYIHDTLATSGINLQINSLTDHSLVMTTPDTGGTTQIYLTETYAR